MIAVVPAILMLCITKRSMPLYLFMDSENLLFALFALFAFKFYDTKIIGLRNVYLCHVDSLLFLANATLLRSLFCVCDTRTYGMLCVVVF